MTANAVVMAAGEGTRLRPLTERWAKPVLPIDGRPVLATLLRELAAAGVRRVWLVTGHLAAQIEALAGDGTAFGLEIVTVDQPIAKGSADALARALAAGAAPPLLLSAAHTTHLLVEGSRILRIRDPEGGMTAAPLMGLREAVLRELPAVCRPPFNAPYEVADAFQRAIDAGATVAAIPTGATRDLTNPLDLVEENFPYLRGLVTK